MKDKSAPLPRAIYALLFVRFVVSLGNFIYPMLALMLTRKLGYTKAAAGVFMSVLSIISAVGMIAGGKLGDTIGRKSTLIGLQAAGILAYIVAAFSGFTAGTAIIVAVGMTALSGTWPVLNAVIADIAPPERRKEAFSLLYWGNNVGFSIGPLLASLVFNKAPILLFLGNAMAISLAMLAIFFFIPETLPARAPHAESNTRSKPTRHESTIYLILKDPVLAIFSLISVFIAFVYNQHTFALPVFLGDLLEGERGTSAFGIAMATNGLTVVCLTIVITFLSKRLPALLSIALASVFYAVGFGSYTLANGLPMVMGSTVVWTIGEILGATNTNAFIAERAQESHRSRINAAISFCYLAGTALSPLVAGPAAQVFGSRAIWIPIGLTAGVVAAASFGLYVFDRKRGKASTPFISST